MTEQPRICLEIRDDKLHKKIKALAKKKGRLLRSIIEDALYYYLENKA